MSDPPLLRPSELARFWGIHPRTLLEHIRSGRLAAVRTPGNHFRVRVADVHAFCEHEKMPLPDFLVRHVRRVVVVGGSEALARSMKLSFRAAGVGLEQIDDAVRGIVVAVSDPPTVIALDAKAPNRFAERAARALRETLDLQPHIVVFDVASAQKCDAFVKAGATRAVTRARRADLVGALVGLATG